MAPGSLIKAAIPKKESEHHQAGETIRAHASEQRSAPEEVCSSNESATVEVLETATGDKGPNEIAEIEDLIR